MRWRNVLHVRDRCASVWSGVIHVVDGRLAVVSIICCNTSCGNTSSSKLREVVDVIIMTLQISSLNRKRNAFKIAAGGKILP